MDAERDLAETAIASDLFGPEGLGESDLPPAPEKYEIVRRLGYGGAGAVYLARDTHLDRPVALKYLRHVRPAELERFFREARFAARLSNPSIVQVYEAGEVEGVPFIALQYIAGGSLAGLTLDRPATIRAIREVAAALAHAHAEGIVHRDIKPENILLDVEGRAYVTDFGIARDLRGELGVTISQQGQILGTPGLMSPEQARGDVHLVDASSDIYSLGATLYYKLTGQPPFKGDNLIDLLHAVIHDDPPFPRRYMADIPRDLEAIVLRCMRKRREERFPSMTAVMEAIDKHLAGVSGTELSPAWFTTFVRRRVDEAPPPSPDTGVSERDLAPALEAAREIAAWDTQLYRVRGDLMRHYPALDEFIARLDRVLDAQPATGWARFYRGVAWFRRGELTRALDDMERAIDRVRDLGTAYFELGRLYLALYLDQHHAAHEHFSHTGTVDQLHHARNRLEQAGIAFEEARRLVSHLPQWQLRYVDAVQRLAEGDLEGCVGACDAILTEDPDLEEVWKLKGDAERRCGRDPLPSYERALDTRRSYYDALVAMSEVHLAAGRPLEARECAARALEVHSGLAVARALLARSYLVEARARGSAASLREGLEQAAQACEAAPERYTVVLTLAELQLEQGRSSGDADWITQSIESLERAARLEGCTNRVDYLRARARVERARLAIAAGTGLEAARADLDAALAWSTHEATQVPDNAPWVTLLDEARALRNGVRS